MKPTFATNVTDSVCKWASPQYMIDCFANISTQEACMVTQKVDLDQMSEGSICRTQVWLNFLLQILGLSALYDPVWTILMILVTCHKLWHIKCPRNFRPSLWMLQFMSLFPLLHVTVRPSIIRPKSKGKQTGRISPMWCGRSSPKHNLSWGKFVHLENLLFTLCEWSFVCFF